MVYSLYKKCLIRKKGHTGLHVQDFETSILAPTDYEIVAIYLKTSDTLNDIQKNKVSNGKESKSSLRSHVFFVIQSKKKINVSRSATVPSGFAEV